MKVVNKKNDCDVIMDGIENSFGNLGNCLESIFDEKQSKIGVMKHLFRFGGSLTKLAVNTTVCALKNTPKAVVAVAGAKRELVDSIENEWNQFNKEQQEEALNKKIKQLKFKIS